MSNVTTRNDVMQLVEKIEVLAKDVRTKLSTNEDILSVANELVRNNMTFVFTLGEYYGQQPTHYKKVKATVVRNPSSTANWHNVRDNRGRFAKKV